MLDNIRDRLPAGGLRLDPRLGMAGLAAAAALLAAMVVYWLWRDSVGYRALYGAHEAFPAADVLQVLDGEGVDYRLHPQTGQVLVREADLAATRLLLSAKGVQVAVPPGYELFDREEPLGSSQFVQDVRLRRSLEGELARTIAELKGVDQVRVHLAQEPSHSFVIGRREPAKASVMLRMAAGQRLAPEQVAAIVNLVAASVPQLAPEAVSVVDQNGVLLSRQGVVNGALQDNQVAEGYRQQALANLDAVLAPVLGAGNYRVSVSPDFDFSQKEETIQAYGDTPRLRNEVVRSENTLDQLALGVPGSLSNRPPPAKPAPPAGQTPAAGTPPPADNPASTSTRSESTRQHELDQRITHVRHPSFQLRRQSVAVVLNAAAAPEGGWSEAARKELEDTLRGAVGFDAERGDQLILSVMPFVAVKTPEEPEVVWWESPQLYEYARFGVVVVLALLLLFLVLRPALAGLRRRQDAPPAALVNGLPAGEQGLLPGRGPGQTLGGGVFGEANPLAEVRLPAPGSGLEMQVEHLQLLARNDPERVSEVIKHWIGRHERDNDSA
ncbi:flagellar basal-body MS-ring/collar protein FliF [Pseudomonas otitidis]|uniref:flagellar basal-body MS-ring/collar protein FliF n=1 Tax=Metapseudomonas otitidis TaxID=319939 RepID=UPI002E7B1DAE|nr:flagellar basal-body MS-ring/collar protein FliF [Pseudomonas otitidis]MEE1894569.1 flagellar basal-body MS-ring/collar protein FliF [Pseudomonas otitidis]